MGRPRPAAYLVVAMAATLSLAACADDAVPVAEEEPEPVEATDITEPPDLTGILPDDEDAPPPTELQREDLVVGDGGEAVPGLVATVQYVGVAWSTREPFDSSWDRGQPFSFEVGGERVIMGWDLGVQGMRVGGRRVLTIPSELAYGERGLPGMIEPDETLVFVVDLLAVDPAG